MISDVGLRVGRNKAAASSLSPAIAFVHRATERGWPANIIALLHTESNPVTGALFYGDRGEHAAYSALPDLLDAFVGEGMRAAMVDGKAKALGAVRPEREHWFQESAASRGGWRGLILVTGGSTIQVPARKDEAIALVERGIFDFVVAFPAQTTLPAHARSFVSSMTRSLAIDNAAEAKSARPPSIWSAFVRAVKHSLAVLESTPIILIFNERGEGPQRHAECRQVGSHMPPFNAWGVQFSACGNGCDVVASDMAFRSDKGAMRCHCMMCGWKSIKVKIDDVADMVSTLCADLPSVYWHAYPPSPHLLSTFSRITAERRE
ncbi:hypothetical protein J3R83DRAFT_13484 [Lanmaoa asiatica]|nr:hypothetical protein J3R83DRAFT_13484 [Lanmaoa asiatica]